MVNKPLIRPYFWGGVALGGVARIPMIYGYMAINEPLTFESGVIDVFIGTGIFTYMDG